MHFGPWSRGFWKSENVVSVRLDNGTERCSVWQSKHGAVLESSVGICNVEEMLEGTGAAPVSHPSGSGDHNSFADSVCRVKCKS